MLKLSLTPLQNPLTDSSFCEFMMPLLHTSNAGSIPSLYTHHVRETQREDQRCDHKLNICFCPWSVFLDIFLSYIPFINSRISKPIPPVFHCIILSCAKRMNVIYMYLEIKTPWRGCKGHLTTLIAKGLEQHWWNSCLHKMWEVLHLCCKMFIFFYLGFCRRWVGTQNFIL